MQVPNSLWWLTLSNPCTPNPQSNDFEVSWFDPSGFLLLRGQLPPDNRGRFPNFSAGYSQVCGPFLHALAESQHEYEYDYEYMIDVSRRQLGALQSHALVCMTSEACARRAPAHATATATPRRRGAANRRRGSSTGGHPNPLLRCAGHRPRSRGRKLDHRFGSPLGCSLLRASETR